MTDEVQKKFVRSFINYLKKQVDSQSLSADAQESVEVAVQCLQAAFDVGEDEERDQETPVQQQQTESAEATSSDSGITMDAKEIDLFELFQSLYIERNPQTLQMAEAIKNEGNRLMKEGKYNEALLQYNRAITFDPKNPIFYCNRAAAYIRLGDNDHAITDCKSALVYNPAYGKAYGRLGIAYSNLQKYEEAQQAYAKAIELEPDNQDYRNNLEVARNARAQAVNALPQLEMGLNAMLSNPAIRNLFSSAEIDLNQLQSMSQNPMIMNAITQMFPAFQAGLAGGGGGGGGGGAPPMPNDMLQLFQNFAAQLANTAAPPGSSPGNNDGTDQQQQQPPPSS